MCKVDGTPFSFKNLVASTAISPPLRIQSTPKKEYLDGCCTNTDEELCSFRLY